MAKKKRGEAHGGGHGWFVTFADLMGLLVAFFVMLVAFSTQDQAKLQIVAGSMRDAFGVQDKVRYSGVIEIPGLPTRPKLKNAAPILAPKPMSSKPRSKAFLRLPAVKATTGLSRSTIYARIRKGSFPRAALGARIVGWLESNIGSWVEDKIQSVESRPCVGD